MTRSLSENIVPGKMDVHQRAVLHQVILDLDSTIATLEVQRRELSLLLEEDAKR